MSRAPAPNFGGKLVLAIFLAAVVGFAWACWDTSTNPLTLISRFTASPEPDTA